MPMALGLGVAIAMSPTPLRAGAAAALLLVLRPLVLPRSIAGGFPGVRTAIGFTLGGLFIVAAGAHPASWTFALVPVVCLSLLATTPVPGLSAVLAGLPTCGALWLGGAASSVVAGAGAAIAVTAWISAPLAREFRRRGASAAAQTRELQMVKERFERAFDGISEGYWDHYDLERGLLFLSPRLRELLGYAGDDLESIPHNYRAWTSRIHPEDRGIARAANHAHMANGELYDVVLRLRMKDDSYRYFRHRGKVYRDADGRPLGVAGTIQDVTDRRRQEKELIEAREEALAAARAKSTFLANMSHEIRTPLNGVLGMLQLLAGSDLDEGQRRQVDLAATSAESLINIINDILDVSKVEAGKMVIESVEFELRELLGDICEGLAPIAERKGIHLVLDMSEVRVTSIRSDPVRLRQVLTNLLSNALKFTERGAVEVRATLQGPRLDIEVRDSGIGIPADKLASLFEAFSQADASTTRRFGGTGLGLSITKLICELMQGTVTVESVEGQGSVFRVEVEVDSAHESRDANPWSPDPAPA
ncbi:MAG: ATP-binding protein, partial [Myxococcota bacterium]